MGMVRGWAHLGCFIGIRELGQKRLERLGGAILLSRVVIFREVGFGKGDMVKLHFRNRNVVPMSKRE